MRPGPVLVAAAVIAAAALAPAFAADEANLNKFLLIRKAAAVRISNLQDFIFPASLTAPSPLEDTVCIYSTEDGRYQVTATSGNASGTQFRLRSGTGSIAYTVRWFDGSGGGTAYDLMSGRASQVLSGADRRNPDCGGGTNARLRIALDPASYEAVPPGTYSDTLTLMVAPY